MDKETAIEFLVILAAMLVGLMLGRLASQLLENNGVPIAGGAPIAVPLGE